MKTEVPVTQGGGIALAIVVGASIGFMYDALAVGIAIGVAVGIALEGVIFARTKESEAS